MVAHPGYFDDVADRPLQARIPGTTSGAGAYDGAETQYDANAAYTPGGALVLLAPLAGGSTNNLPISVNSNAHAGALCEGVGGLWWEHVHVLPRTIALGNVLSTVDTVIDVFNAYRETSQSWTTFVNNAGAGSDMIDETLAEVFTALEGRLFTFRVTTEGPAEVNTTLDYTFTGEGLIYQGISFVRSVVWPFRPELGMNEVLAWLTKIIPHGNGTEQRVSCREYPRQFFKFKLQRKNGPERQRLENRIQDRQDLPWGFPAFADGDRLAVAASPLDVVLNVRTTIYSDFRVGGQVMLRNSEVDYEVGLITDVTPTTITISSGLVGSFAVGTEVLPVRTAILKGALASDRYSDGVAVYDVTFEVTDNAADLAQANFWPTYGGKLLLDDYNFIQRTLRESSAIPVTVLDGETGRVLQLSSQDVSTRGGRKTFLARNRAELFRVRQLLYYLRGRQVSFRLPTFGRDFTLVADLVSAAVTATVVNTGYSQFAQSRAPRNVLRVWLKDGTSIVRTITDASEVDPDTEQLTVDAGWPSNVAVADVELVDVVELVRQDNDEVTLQHQAPGRARVSFPTKAVLS